MIDPDEVARIAEGLTEAQLLVLEEVCRLNGAGLRIPTLIRGGSRVPSYAHHRALWDLDLIQGKSGGDSQVVHTRKGLAVRNHLKGQTDEA